MNNRRKVIAALGVGAFTFPLGPFAQTLPKVWRIGVLNPSARPAPETRSVYTNFFEALRDLGYVDGRDIAVQWLSADSDLQQLPGLAARLVKSKVDLIVTNGTQAVRAALQATATVPILALTFGDPVASGFAKSLARPGGNVTGTSLASEELNAKRLEILAEIVPHVTRIAFLMNPDNPAAASVSVPILERTVRKANKEIVIVHVRGEQEFNAAFAQIIRERAGAVLVALDAVLNDHWLRIGELAWQHRLPSMFGTPRGAERGLVSYGVDFIQLARSSARMAVKIFKGAKPADIPIELPTHFELAVNLTTAKTLGITIPATIMVQATRVIQ